LYEKKKMNCDDKLKAKEPNEELEEERLKMAMWAVSGNICDSQLAPCQQCLRKARIQVPKLNDLASRLNFSDSCG
jgi:hypothetical protein